MSGRRNLFILTSTGVLQNSLLFYVIIESEYRTRSKNSTIYNELMIIIDHDAMRDQVRVMLVDIRLEDLLPWTISYLASDVKLTLLNEATVGFHHTNNFS